MVTTPMKIYSKIFGWKLTIKFFFGLEYDPDDNINTIKPAHNKKIIKVNRKIANGKKKIILFLLKKSEQAFIIVA